MGFKCLSNSFYHAACTRTCIPLKEATGIFTVKMRATPAKMRLAKGRFAQSPLTCYPGLVGPWEGNVCG